MVLGIIVCLVVAGISFFGGMKYGQNNKGTSFADRQGQFNQNSFGQNATGSKSQGMRGVVNGGGVVSGEIISKDATSMTIKLRDGGSKIVLFSPASKVEKTVDGTVADVVVGKSVMITGTTNTDGSVSATSIQMRPTLAIPQVKTN